LYGYTEVLARAANLLIARAAYEPSGGTGRA
jgi:hypothetical protein